MRSTATLILAAVLWGACAGADVFRKSGKFIPVGPNPSAIIALDLNGDNLPEIVTADLGTLNDLRGSTERPANDELSLLMAQPDLTYTRRPLRVGFGPFALDWGEMDDSRGSDIVVACFHDARNRDLFVLRNLGDNLFEPREFTLADETLTYQRMRDSEGQPVFATPGLTSVVVRDFNGDGFRDVVATGWCSDVLVFFPGAAEKCLGEPRLIAAPGGPRSVAAADFNKDGKLDLVTTQYSSGEVAVWKGDGKGSFEPVNRFSSRGRLPHKVAVADFNRDNILDIVVTQCEAEDSAVIFYGDGDFSFSVSQELTLGKDPDVLEHEIRDLVVEDLDGNGRPDIALACYGSGQVNVFFGMSTDSGVPQRFHKEQYTFDEARPRALCAADLNQDGSLDLAVTLWPQNTVTFLMGRPPQTSKED